MNTIDAYGPERMRNRRQEKVNTCISFINDKITEEFGPIVKIDLEEDFDFSRGLPWKDNEEIIINTYLKSGWSKVEFVVKEIEGREREEYFHPPSRMHLILTK